MIDAFYGHQIRKISVLLLAISFLVISGIVVLVIASDQESVSAQELVEITKDESDRLTAALEPGSLLHIRIVSFVRDRRSAPPDLVESGAFDYPDTVVDEVWITVGPDGMASDYLGLLSTEDGQQLQRTDWVDGARVFTDVATGVTQRFPQADGEASEQPVSAWVTAAADLVDRTVASGEYTVADNAAQLDGEQAIEFVRDFKANDGRALRDHLLVSTENPLRSHSTVYRIPPDGAPKRISSNEFTTWMVFAPGTEPGTRP